MIGWIRMMIIYISSGCVGTLASAILTPYQVEVGILHAVNSDPALINSVIWYTIHNVVLQYHNSKSLCSLGINVFFQGYTESRYWNEFFWCTYDYLIIYEYPNNIIDCAIHRLVHLEHSLECWPACT